MFYISLGIQEFFKGGSGSPQRQVRGNFQTDKQKIKPGVCVKPPKPPWIRQNAFHVQWRRKGKSWGGQSMFCPPPPILRLWADLPPPQYTESFLYASDVPLTLKHVLLDCADFMQIRTSFYQVSSLQDLFSTVSPKIILVFLRQLGLD